MSKEHINSETLSLNEMLQIRRDKLKKLQDAGRNPFKIEKYIKTHHSKQVKDNFDKLEGSEVSLAGRIMNMREHGKASFIDIQDEQGRIQIYVRQDAIGEESYGDFITYDMGDIVGVEGTVFITQKGEQSVKASKVTLLTKSLQILPEKYHGLKDADLRYRQRYMDLIVNPDVKEAFIIRSKAIKALKEYLDDRDFLEVDTPILSTVAGGATAKPFITHHNTLDLEMYMRIANELYLKRLIVGGFERVYELGRMFRNEGMSIKHNPEYTAIEVYQAYADYEDIMKLTEESVAYMAEKSLGTTKINYQALQKL